jgi:hypothetical protein
VPTSLQAVKIGASRISRPRPQCGPNRIRITHVAVHKLGAVRHDRRARTMDGRQHRIQHSHLMSGRQKVVDDMAADESGPAGDENLHVRTGTRS